MTQTKTLLLLFIIIFLSSCVGDSLLPVKGPEGDPENELNLAEFDDIPIPLNSKLDKKESIIISKRNGWLDDSHSTHLKLKLLFLTFFRNELPKFGWKTLRNFF